MISKLSKMLLIFVFIGFLFAPTADVAASQPAYHKVCKKVSKKHAKKYGHKRHCRKVRNTPPKPSPVPAPNPAPLVSAPKPAPAPAPVPPAPEPDSVPVPDPPPPPPPPLDCSNGYVALTFDDGPTGMTQQYLDALKAGRAHATFFVTGQRVNANAGLVRTILNDGHDLANHTMTHPTNLQMLSDSGISSEIQGQSQAVQTATGGYVETMFRPPYGNSNQAIYNVAIPGLTRHLDLRSEGLGIATSR